MVQEENPGLVWEFLKFSMKWSSSQEEISCVELRFCYAECCYKFTNLYLDVFANYFELGNHSIFQYILKQQLYFLICLKTPPLVLMRYHFSREDEEKSWIKPFPFLRPSITEIRDVSKYVFIHPLEVTVFYSVISVWFLIINVTSSFDPKELHSQKFKAISCDVRSLVSNDLKFSILTHLLICYQGWDTFWPL